MSEDAGSNPWPELEAMSEVDLWQRIAEFTKDARGIVWDLPLDEPVRVRVPDDDGELAWGDIVAGLQLKVDCAIVEALDKRYGCDMEDLDGGGMRVTFDVRLARAPAHEIPEGTPTERREAAQRERRCRAADARRRRRELTDQAESRLRLALDEHGQVVVVIRGQELTKRLRLLEQRLRRIGINLDAGP